MSLHIGRLSPRVRQEELEHLFQRYGSCSVRLKDGYGFAIYEVTSDAERALHMLRGKFVCGERITLHWSKRQPRPFRRPTGSSRFREPSRGRNFRDEGSDFRFRGSQGQNDLPPIHDGRHGLNDSAEKEADDAKENAKDSGDDKKELSKDIKKDEGDINDAVDIKNDRWGETSNIAGGENVEDFHRYEPYHGYVKRDENDNFHRAGTHDSPDHRHSLEKRREHSADHIERNDMSKAPPTCYNCGLVGHIMRKCPQGEVQGRNFKQRKEELSFREKQELRLKRFGSDSWRRPDFGIDAPIPKQQHETIFDRTRSEKIVPERRRRQYIHTGEDSLHGNRLEKRASKKVHKINRSRRSNRSSLSSGSSTNSPSDSLSKRCLSRSSSDSRSASSRSRSRSRSRSAHSSSKSASPCPRSRASRSRSRSSFSFPISLSVSVSPQHKSASSPDDKQPDVPVNHSLEANVQSVTSPETKYDTKQEFYNSALHTQVADSLFKLDARSNGEHLMHGHTAEYSSQKGGNKETNLGENLGRDAAVTREIESQISNSKDPSSVKTNNDTPARNERNNSVKLAGHEAFAALRHYGMEAPAEGSSDISVEEHFGAARLWPWELIYYRQLKKGSISTENYARRLEQNKKFGIVDKYVRSSSGWWECS